MCVPAALRPAFGVRSSPVGSGESIINPSSLLLGRGWGEVPASIAR